MTQIDGRGEIDIFDNCVYYGNICREESNTFRYVCSIVLRGELNRNCIIKMQVAHIVSSHVSVKFYHET